MFFLFSAFWPCRHNAWLHILFSPSRLQGRSPCHSYLYPSVLDCCVSQIPLTSASRCGPGRSGKVKALNNLKWVIRASASGGWAGVQAPCTHHGIMGMLFLLLPLTDIERWLWRVSQGGCVWSVPCHPPPVLLTFTPIVYAHDSHLNVVDISSWLI